jgi:hypothetical protein
MIPITLLGSEGDARAVAYSRIPIIQSYIDHCTTLYPEYKGAHEKLLMKWQESNSDIIDQGKKFIETLSEDEQRSLNETFSFEEQRALEKMKNEPLEKQKAECGSIIEGLVGDL